MKPDAPDPPQAPGVLRPIRVRALATTFALLAAAAASAYEPERAALYFANELAECGAWFRLVAEAPGVETSDRIKFRAVGMALVNSAADLQSERFALDRANAANATIWREMDGWWRNFPVVKAKYDQRCRDVVADPIARRTYWLDKRS
jgi:hypothetical protein